MKHWKSGVAAATLLAAASAYAGGLDMRPGLWEVVTTTTTTGLPFAMPAKTSSSKHCISEKQLAAPWKGLQDNKNCKVTELHSDRNGASWEVRCTGEAAAQGKGRMTMDSPTAYHGYVDLTTSEGGLKMHVHTELTGRRIGNCTGSH